MQAPDLESLQEKASELYLQGEFREALAVWRKLLEHSPDHERAREGVRLCEVLAEQMEAAESANIDLPPKPPAPEPPPVPAAEADPLDLDLSALNLDAEAPSAPEPPAPAAQPARTAEPLDLDRQGEGIDLGDSEATETIALGSPAGAASPSDTAATELQQRLRELIAEALQAESDGDTELALSLVGRVFILDEENQAAREIQARLAPEPEADAEADVSEEPAPAAPTELPGLDIDAVPELDLGDLEAKPSETPTVEPSAPPAPPAPPAEDLLKLADEVPLDPGLEESPLDSLPGEDAVIDERVSAEPPLSVIPKKNILPAKPLVIAVGAIVVAGAAFLGWRQLNGASREPDPAARPAAASGAPTADAEPAPAQPQGVPTEAARPRSTEELATVLARARAAFEAGDYAAAVLAYNEVVRREPGNVEAQDQLIVAGERYRERNEMLQQWERAIELFNQGDYRSSLVLLYRLPKTEDPERVARYSRNGWYNMGLRSLQSGDCKTARGHFKEARDIDPSDAATLQGLELCRSCLNGDKSPSYYRTVNQLTFRGLED